MMVQLSILPVSGDQHISTAVAKAVKIIAESGLEYKLTPMATLIIGEWKEVMAVAKKCHDAVRADYDRVITQIKIDDVKDASISFDDKINAVEKKAGKTFKK
jgi:uncharacterized protein (TIGR00106 family)